MAEDYKIELGVKLNTSNLKTEIDKIDDKYKVKLGVDVAVNDIKKRISDYNKNTNNAKLRLKVKLDTDDLKKQINSLNVGGKNSKNVSIPINTQSLKTSFEEVKGIIADIRNAIGTLDNGGDIKSLVSSINQMATALGKAENESESLVKSLSALSKKDFSLNIGLDMGKKNNNMIAYGRAARKQVIPELEAQIKYLENLFGGQQATMSKLASQGGKIGFDVFTDFGDFNSDSAIRKMEAMEKYINSLKKLAAIDNINLDGFNAIHRDATGLINDIAGVENAVDKAGDVPEKIKNLLGSGVDGEILSKQLDDIVLALKEIKENLQSLSSGFSIEGLTQSFDKLSDTIEKLVQNATQAKNVLGDGINTTISDSGTEKAIREQKELAQASTQTANIVAKSGEKIQQAYQNISTNTSSVGDTDILKLKDDITDADRLSAAISKLKNVQRSIDKIEIGKIDASKGVQEIQTLERQLESLSAEHRETVAEINKLGGVSKTQYQSIQNQVNTTNLKLEQLKSKIADTQTKLANGIRIKIQDTGFDGFEQEIIRAKTVAEKFKGSSDKLQDALRQLDIAMDAINAADEANDVNALITANTQYEAVLKQVYSQIKLNQQAERDNNNSEALIIRKQNALERLKGLFGANSQAAKMFGLEVQQLQNEISECGNISSFGNIEKKITNLTQRIKNANVQTETFGQKLKNQWEQYKTYLSVASLISYGTQALRSMFEQVKLIDSAMTELKKVTNETDEAYSKFLTNAATRSREIGTTIDGLVSSTADFARLGYGFEDAQGLAEVANIYAVVGDEIEGVEGATESLISTMAAFKEDFVGLSNTDSAMRIVDIFNELGNNFAISSGGLGEAFERSASSLAAANNSIHESAALITAANTVVQDPAQVGQAFKTISMRIRGAKTELEEAGLETDGMVDSTAKLREEIMALSGVDIMENG